LVDALSQDGFLISKRVGLERSFNNDDLQKLSGYIQFTMPQPDDF
jgi:hypothetical protein